MSANASPKSPNEFNGRHFLATYLDCDPAALADRTTLAAALSRAAREAGAKVLGLSEHAFEPKGYSAVLLLAESHASIHTYPERGACFVDLFTCGSGCSPEAFDAALRQVLRPARIERRIVSRLLAPASLEPDLASDGREWRVGA